MKRKAASLGMDWRGVIERKRSSRVNPNSPRQLSFSRRIVATWAILLAGLPSTRADTVDGSWSEIHDWPLIAIHAALTPDGRVLTYGTDGTGKQTGYFVYDIWDPAAGLDAGHMTLDNMTLTDIFCSSQIILPQSGEILIAGGDNWTGAGTTNTGNNNANLFDFGDNTLARSANMNRSRWYSSSTALVNGEIYIQGGNGGADRPEVRQVDGGFRLLSGVPTNSYAALFPRNFLAPDGRVFGYDTSGKMYFVDTAGAGSLSPAGQFSSSYAGWTSGAAMFRPGKILQMGGNSSGVVTVDITGPEPVVTPTATLSSQRHWVSATVLADGQVVATGGSSSENKLTGVNNKAEIWNPGTGQWHVGAEGALARLYHSSALLLPDASVLVAGGGAPGPLNNTNAEIYYPPYLFDSAGGFATRPQIVSVPNTANVGDSISVQVDSSVISRVTLVKSGSVTHSVNMDQRFLELPFSASGNMLQIDLPDRASDTPPGYYLLFVINDAGVPSVSTILRINVDPTPNVAVDYTAAIGGGGGSSFQLSCSIDEILVGVHGRFDTYVNMIGPQCVQMDQFGRWIGDPVDGPPAGSMASGTGFSRTCPRDSAVSGFRGRAGQYVNQLEIECRTLTPSGGLTGDGLFLGPDGGNGGTVQSAQRCGTDNPAHALYGRSGGWLDSFGLQCKEALVTTISVNSTPVIVNPGPQSGTVGTQVDLQIGASDGDGDDLMFSATGLPAGLILDTESGQISGVPAVDGTFSVSMSVSDGTESDNTVFAFTIAASPPLLVEAMSPPAPRKTNTVVDYLAISSGGVNVVYNWNFGDGSPETGFSSSSAVAHTFAEPGIYYVTLTVDSDFDVPSIQTFVQGIHRPHTAEKPAGSSNIVYEQRSGGSPRLWVVNQDNDSVTVFDAATHLKITEIPVGIAPRALAIAPDSRIWVTNKMSADISIIDPVSLGVAQTLPLPRASQPYGIVFSPVAGEAFVALEASNRLLKLDANSGAELMTMDTGGHPRHVTINGSSNNVYVSLFITPPQPGEDSAAVQSESGGAKNGGQIQVVDTESMTVTDTIVLQHGDLPDAENQGRGVPNYVGAVAISPDGLSARVPSKQDNIARGELRDPGFNLNFQNTVRAISSRILLDSNTEDYSRRIDYDNSSVASAAVFEPIGIYAFVALETSREVAVVDAYAFVELFRIDVGRAPQGLAVSPDGMTLYVNNFMDRTVDVFDLTDLQTLGQWFIPSLGTLSSVTTEKLEPEVLLGKQLFYDARDTRLARDRYLSCASCHNDGGHDGRTWDLTGFGEGLRNTISLRGTAANHGKLHWSENFDEVQDFEGQIRSLAEGTGLMTNPEFAAGTRSDPLGDPKAGVSADLDALAAYVASLGEFAESPFRNRDGSLTIAAAAGREIFRRKNCAVCHSGVGFTDSADDVLHDIGTLKPGSGMRLGQPLPGIDTPTLRGLPSSSPYLHDGSAATLAAAVSAHDAVSLDAGDRSLLVAYLMQIDDREVSAPLPNAVPVISGPGDQLGEVGTSVILQIQVSDDDGGTLSYSATGLPPGLSIDTASGAVTGTPIADGNFAVIVTVVDGEDSAVASFTWMVMQPNRPPTIVSPGPQSSEAGSAVNLAIEASDSDGDILSFAASGLPSGLSINSINGVIGGSPSTPGNHRVTVTVSDGADTATSSFDWNVRVRNTAIDSSANGGGGAVGLNWLLALLSILAARSGKQRQGMTMKTGSARMLALLLLITAGYQGIHSGAAVAATLPAYDRVRILHSPREITEVELTDQEGKPFSISMLLGPPVLVLFGFTHCPDVCPMALQKLAVLEKDGGEGLADLKFVMISVDGKRDSPEIMKAYLSPFSPRFIGLTGEPDRVKSIAAEFSAAFFKETTKADGQYDVSHSPQVFVLDQFGRLRAEMYNATTDAMHGVARALLDEAESAAKSVSHPHAPSL